MGYEQSVLRRATARLEAQRKAREEAQERLRSEIYAKLPRVAAIDRELRRTITQIIAASLRDGSDPVPAIGVIRDKNLSLQAEKAALLTEHGYPADALDDKPACPKCSDTGWVGANMCACLKALCTEEQIRELSKLLDLGEQSFDSFSLDYYPPLPWPGESLSPRENMEFIFDVCSSYARKFGRFYFRNLFLTGAPGLGKTFLSACIARTVSESGFSVVYDTAVNIFTRFEEQKFARDKLEAGEAKDETRRYLGCDLLILDDLGSELSTPFVQSALYTLINTRLTADKRTVISSNLTMDQVRARYTPQIASRLEGEYQELTLQFNDLVWELVERKNSEDIHKAELPKLLFRVVDFMERRTEWVGTATELLTEMREQEVTPNMVTKYLGQFAFEVLEPLGIEYRTKRTGKSRLIKFLRRDGDDANDAGIAI